MKKILWTKLLSFFTLPVLETVSETEKLKAKVKKFALSKMAQQFNKFKNNLYRDYLKNREPKEWTGPMVKQREYWPQFLEMKKSDVFKKRSATNKVNASKKKKTPCNGDRWLQVEGTRVDCNGEVDDGTRDQARDCKLG